MPTCSVFCLLMNTFFRYFMTPNSEAVEEHTQLKMILFGFNSVVSQIILRKKAINLREGKEKFHDSSRTHVTK